MQGLKILLEKAIRDWRRLIASTSIGLLFGLFAGYRLFTPSREIAERRDKQQIRQHEISVNILKTVVTPGMTRAQVADRLKELNVGFGESCCEDHGGTARVLGISFIGNENSQEWFCGPVSIYAAFSFNRSDRDELKWDAAPTDLLREVKLIRRWEDCL